MPAYKIGSGGIMDEFNNKFQRKKPIFLATGASNINEVVNAAEIFKNKQRIMYYAMQYKLYWKFRKF